MAPLRYCAVCSDEFAASVRRSLADEFSFRDYADGELCVQSKRGVDKFMAKIDMLDAFGSAESMCFDGPYAVPDWQNIESNRGPRVFRRYATPAVVAASLPLTLVYSHSSSGDLRRATVDDGAALETLCLMVARLDAMEERSAAVSGDGSDVRSFVDNFWTSFVAMFPAVFGGEPPRNVDVSSVRRLVSTLPDPSAAAVGDFGPEVVVVDGRTYPVTGSSSVAEFQLRSDGESVGAIVVVPPNVVVNASRGDEQLNDDRFVARLEPGAFWAWKTLRVDGGGASSNRWRYAVIDFAARETRSTTETELVEEMESSMRIAKQPPTETPMEIEAATGPESNEPDFDILEAEESDLPLTHVLSQQEQWNIVGRANDTRFVDVARLAKVSNFVLRDYIDTVRSMDEQNEIEADMRPTLDAFNEYARQRFGDGGGAGESSS